MRKFEGYPEPYEEADSARWNLHNNIYRKNAIISSSEYTRIVYSIDALGGHLASIYNVADAAESHWYYEAAMAVTITEIEL